MYNVINGSSMRRGIAARHPVFLERRVVTVGRGQGHV